MYDDPDDEGDRRDEHDKLEQPFERTWLMGTRRPPELGHQDPGRQAGKGKRAGEDPAAPPHSARGRRSEISLSISPAIPRRTAASGRVLRTRWAWASAQIWQPHPCPLAGRTFPSLSNLAA